MKKRLEDKSLLDCLKACRKASREEEIAAHGRPAGCGRVHKSKKVYDRKRIKAADKKSMPFLFVDIKIFANIFGEMMPICLLCKA